MAKKSHFKSSRQRKPQRKESVVTAQTNPAKPPHVYYQIIAFVLATALLAGGSLAHWRSDYAKTKIDKPTPTTSQLPPLPTKAPNTFNDLPDLPPPPTQPTMAGYNANSGMLPPGALPPGVVLPGITAPLGMMPATTMMQGSGSATNVRQGFTGKEFDSETGLNYFGARYHSPTQGRFTSVDPENASADLEDPQSWNGYAYARNNPLKYVDLDGREFVICNNDGTNCHRHKDKDFNNLRKQFSWEVKDGKILQDGQQVATYRRISDDNWSDFQNGVVFGNPDVAGLAQRAPAAGRAALAIAGTGAVIGSGIGGAAYGVTSTLTLAGAEQAFVNRIGYLSIQQLNNVIRGTQKQALGKLFGNGVEGATQALNNMRIPPELTRQALLV